MRNLSKNRDKVAAMLCVICFICAVFSGCTNNQSEEILQNESLQYSAESVQPEMVTSREKKVSTIDETKSNSIDEIKAEEAHKEQKPEKEEKAETELKCTLLVDCSNAVLKLGNEVSLLPEDGKLFEEKEVVFYDGESVFDVLLREMKKNGIHLEFVNVPIYNSSYIEGIGNLYEFDCGELSGWMYRVNGEFPNRGASAYKLQSGDRVEWVYTCDLGYDVGGENSARNGMEYE